MRSVCIFTEAVALNFQPDGWDFFPMNKPDMRTAGVERQSDKVCVVVTGRFSPALLQHVVGWADAFRLWLVRGAHRSRSAPYLSLRSLRLTSPGTPLGSACLSSHTSNEAYLGLGTWMRLFIRSYSGSSGTWTVVWLMLSRILFGKTLRCHCWALMVRWKCFFFCCMPERCCVLDEDNYEPYLL